MADNNEIIRPRTNFTPSLWGDRFSSIAVIDDQTIDRWLKEVEELKAEVKCRLTNLSTAVEEQLALINILERVGISYLFQKEIVEQLKKMFVTSPQFHTHRKQDLSIISLYFRLLRQHGFCVSSQIFEEFKDEEGFKNHLHTDFKGLLNLYEAAHTRIHGDDILEEALAFASTHLEMMIPHLPPSLAKHCFHTLEHPFHKCLPRVEASFFISLYEGEEEESNNLVLRLAKLDHNLLQILHRKELAASSSWWKDLIPKYPYARDRMVELYFWILGIHYEPQYSLTRAMLTRLVTLFNVIDDTYDSYGTVDELKVFTEAIERWNISENDQLPEYMKALYKDVMELYVYIEEQLQQLGRSCAASHAKESMILHIQSLKVEAKWFLEGYIPSFEEYLKTALITTGYFLATTTSLLGTESATNETFEWLKTNPKILKASATICRLTNDISSYEIDKKKGQLITGIDCYMKQYEVTKEEAMDKLNNMVQNAWKDLNEGCLGPKTALEDIILMRVLNLARLGETLYRHKQDGLTNPEKGLKRYVSDMLLDTFEV